MTSYYSTQIYISFFFSGIILIVLQIIHKQSLGYDIGVNSGFNINLLQITASC